MMKDRLLADEIKVALGADDQDTSKESRGFAKAIIEEMKEKGMVNFAPGTIKGTTVSGGALQGGSGNKGIILGMTDSSLAKRIAAGAGYPSVTKEVKSLAKGIVDHLQDEGQVVFSKGKITGVTANSPSSAGPLSGEGTGGKIVNLSGQKMGNSIGGSLFGFTSKELVDMCGAITDHIALNAEVQFKTGDVTGIAPSGGGPLSGGAATLGRIF